MANGKVFLKNMSTSVQRVDINGNPLSEQVKAGTPDPTDGFILGTGPAVNRTEGKAPLDEAVFGEENFLVVRGGGFRTLYGEDADRVVVINPTKAPLTDNLVLYIAYNHVLLVDNGLVVYAGTPTSVEEDVDSAATE